MVHRTITILLTKTTAAQNEAALSYHRLRGLYVLAVVFVRIIRSTRKSCSTYLFDNVCLRILIVTTNY